MKQAFLAVIIFTACIVPARSQSAMVAPPNEKHDAGTALTYAMEGNEVQTGSSVAFAKASAKILSSSNRALQTIKKFLDDKSSISTLRIEGHLSCGNNSAQTLSEQRALAVAAWLVANGIDCKRLIAVGFGCNKPITDTSNEQAERITFVAAAMRGRPVGGLPADGGGKVAGDVCK